MSDESTLSDDFAREYETEEVAFRKDGTIILRIDDQRLLLRRPKFKELRTLREEVAEIAEQSRLERQPLLDRLEELTKPLTARLDDLQDDPESAHNIAQVEQELREVQRSEEWLQTQEALKTQRVKSDIETLTWFRDSILARFGKPVPVIEDPEDLPPWVIDQEFVGSLLTHWSTVPRRPGVA